MDNLSVVINAQNAEKDLPRAISSAKILDCEIVVVDQGSTDKTFEIAKRLGAKVFKHGSVDYVEKARNFAISKAKGPWILVLDPDEEVPKKLADEIKKNIKENKFDYFRIPRKNVIFGKWMKHSRWWPDYNIRLFKKGFVSWNEVIHAVPMTQGTGSEFPEKEEIALIHHHYDSIEQYLERMNRYTTVQAAHKLSENYNFSWKDLVEKPSREFLSRYFFGEGYKDGVHGLALSFLQSFSELVLYLKIWQASKFKEGDPDVKDVVGLISDREKDTHFWENDALYKSSGKLGYRIKRKLKI